MKLYKLPLGIKIPEDDEYPAGYDVKSINDKRNSANIIEGFIIQVVSGEKFSHYVEVNIDVDKIWNLFCSITNKLVDDTAYGIIGFKGEKPTLSKFTNKERLLKIFEEYKFELTNDGYLEFGMAYHDENSLNQIFVSNFKYMKIWTDRKEALVDNLNSNGIQQIENLQFVDEFPIVSKALTANMDKGIRHYSEVIDCIEHEFLEL